MNKGLQAIRVKTIGEAEIGESKTAPVNLPERREWT